MDSEDDDKTEMLDPLFLRARSRVGSTLRGKWRLDVLLGVGGMAAVYAATHRNGSRAAVKLLHPELSVDPEMRSRFVREGHVANAVGHDGAVKVIDDDTAEDGSLFLVTELLEGETLEERRSRSGGRMDEDDVLSIADQLLDVLAAAQQKGVVHRDLKPENVFVTRAGQVKVLDFGIARLRELSTRSTATRAGTAMGTPAYMPPEQARGRWDEVDARSDLWAVGATMFHLLTGRMVHEGQTTNEVLLSAMTTPAPPLASVAPGVGAAVAHLVDRALAFDKAKRWPDATRMQEAVRHAFHDRHGKPITTSPRLTVPETVPNRTLANAEGAVGARLPTTGQPVARSKPETPAGSAAGRSPREWADRLLRQGGRRLVLVGAAAAVAVFGLGLAVLSVRMPASSAAASSAPAVPVPVPAASSAPLASPPPSAATPPVIAATDLPTPAPAKAESRPAVTTRAAPAANLAPAAPPVAVSEAKPNCKPPYTIDPATGKKHFKVECL